ncbi:MAG: hypothetical protein JSU87_13815 [Gemmatimonadota bacterium]|nr:MAG: hypothetical protein JSU87_13815 [Gemmatimonadota bacterium]
MMSDPKTVDRTTADELTGRPVLVIDEDRAWREAELMHRQLAAKTKYYVRYSRSPKFKAEHGRSSEKAIVRLVTQHTPGDATLRFFTRVAYELSKHGLSFEHQLGEHGIPVTITPSAEEIPEDEPVRLPFVPPPPSPAQPRDSGDQAPKPPPAVESPEAAAARSDTPAPSFLDLEFDTTEFENDEETPSVEELALAEEELPPTGAMPSFDEPTTLERLIDGDAFLDWEETPTEVAEPPARSAAAPSKRGKPSYPPFFPEEEFGRAIPDMDDVEAVFALGSEPAVIESGTGKRFVLDTAAAERESQAARRTEGRPSLRGAIGAAASAAIVGAIGWALLAIPAGGGASPLSVALALMVGMNVRVRGAGSTRRFRIVGLVGAVLGSLLGGFLTALTLTLAGVGFDEIPGDHATGLTGLVTLVTNPDALLAAIDHYYNLIDLAFVALAAYIAFKLAATKPA